MLSITLSNLSFYYEKSHKVLHDVSMFVAAGEVACLLGPSGSGKTTVLNIVSGIYSPVGGSVRIGDKLICSASYSLAMERRDIAFVFQQPVLLPNKDVVNNVAYAIKDGKNKKKIDYALRLLDTMKIADLALRMPNELSIGQQQRVVLARAFAQDADIILLDEPFANLDSITGDYLRNELRLIVKDRGLTVLFVTHDRDDALMLADKIYIIDRGVILQSGTAAALYKNPASSFVVGMYGHCNIFKYQVKDGLIFTSLGILRSPFNGSVKNVAICTRPEAFNIASDIDIKNNNYRKAKITGCIFFGMYYLIYLIFLADEEQCDTYAMYCKHALHVGEVCDVRLPESKDIFIFEDSKR